MEAGVNHFAVHVHVPMSIPRRLLAWWAAQIKHMLPPTIFFFVGFNLILWTKQLILKDRFQWVHYGHICRAPDWQGCSGY